MASRISKFRIDLSLVDDEDLGDALLICIIFSGNDKFTDGELARHWILRTHPVKAALRRRANA